jgi:hypothetical protein
VHDVPPRSAVPEPGPAAHTGRGVAVLLLVITAIVGVRARPGASLSSRPRQAPGGAWVNVVLSVGGLVIGTAALAAVLLTTWRVARRLRRKRDKDQPPHVVEPPVAGLGARLAALTVALLVIGAAVGAVILGARVGGGSRGSSHTPTQPPTSSPAPTHAPLGHADRSGPGFLWLLAVGLVLLVVVAVLVVIARARARRHPGVEPTPAPAPSAAPPPASSERPALGSDARSAVIAQYLALERELARTRLRREPFETPMELLERARNSGLETSEARRLAGLFTLARYSSRPVTAGQREEAERSLAAVRRQWAHGARTTTSSPPDGEEP